MDMTTVFEKYDVSLADALKPETLVELVKIHADLVSSLSTETETQAKRESETREALLSQTDRNVYGNIEDHLRQVIADFLTDDPNLSVALVQILQTIKSDTITFRDFHVASVVRDSKPAKVKDEAGIAVRKSEAETLRDGIVSVWNLIGKPEGLIPTKKNKAGDTVLDLPRIPGGNTSGNVGRGAKVRQMRFMVNNEEVPAGELFYDVLQNRVNDFARGEIVRPTDVWELVENSNQDKYPEGFTNAWRVELFDGRVVLHGWLPEDDEK